MRKILNIILIISLLTNLPLYAKAPVEDTLKSEYLENIHKWRALLYNGLNLCPEQVEKFEEIYNRQPDKNLIKKNKELNKILTKEQRAKYSMIRKLQKDDFKKKEKDYYKSNPKLPKFGNPQT